MIALAFNIALLKFSSYLSMLSAWRTGYVKCFSHQTKVELGTFETAAETSLVRVIYFELLNVGE